MTPEVANFVPRGMVGSICIGDIEDITTQYINLFFLKFIMPINVKMPTIVGIITFIRIINTISESFKA